MKQLFLVLSLITAYFAAATPVYAIEPTRIFTSCLTPTGNVIANYPDGTHGIVGFDSREGRDVVYSLGNDNAMQCFCSPQNTGIQTNWMSTKGLSEDEVKVFKSQGWIYVPSGHPWGLAEGSYLAQNIDFSCNGGSTPGGGDGKSDGRSDGKSDGHSSTVQGSRGDLASTGNILFVLGTLGAGVILVATGLVIGKKKK